MSIELKTASGGSVTLVPEDGVSNTQAVIPQNVGELYGKGNVVGTVSQSGGVPTGAIIERGSNANGEFVRYADGTQICLKTFLVQNSTPTQVGTTGLYTFSTLSGGTYPASFVGSSPSLNVTATTTTGSTTWGASGGSVGSLNNAPAEVRCLTTFSVNNSYRISVSAIGRWY